MKVSQAYKINSRKEKIIAVIDATFAVAKRNLKRFY